MDQVFWHFHRQLSCKCTLSEGLLAWRSFFSAYQHVLAFLWTILITLLLSVASFSTSKITFLDKNFEAYCRSMNLLTQGTISSEMNFRPFLTLNSNLCWLGEQLDREYLGHRLFPHRSWTIWLSYRGAGKVSWRDIDTEDTHRRQDHKSHTCF